MKKLLSLLFISSLAFTSCTDGDSGPPGPPGPQGPQGESGAELLGYVVDVEGDFNESNDYSLFVDFTQENFEVFDTDAILVYTKVGEDGSVDGQPVEVWRQLPQTYYLDNGDEIQYNFDYTYFDVLIFLDGSLDPSEYGSLDVSWTEDLVFRVVVVPADFAETTSIDVANYQAVMTALEISENDIKKVTPRKK